MYIYYAGNCIKSKNVLIGIYDKKLFKNNKYNALIGLEILEGEGEIKNEYSESIKI